MANLIDSGTGVEPSKPGTHPLPTNQPSKVGIRSFYPDTFPTLFAVHGLHPMHEVVCT